MKRLCAFTLVFALCALPVWAQDAASEFDAKTAFTRTPEIIEAPETKLLDSEGAGRLYQVGEHLVCVMEGTPTEMGFQHGRLLAKRVESLLTGDYVQRSLWDRGFTREYIIAQSERMEKFFPPEYIEEMKGLVAGLKAAGVTGVEYEEVRTAVTQAEILHFAPDAPPGCSNFACWGQWTPDGRLLHGRNLDWDVKSGSQEGAAILVWRPKGGTPFMMVGWAGGIGSVSGMSAKGITIGEMTLPSGNATFDGLPLFLLMRRVLDSTSNIDEAVDFIKNTPRTSGWNFVVGDANGPDGRAFETDAKNCWVYKPMDPKETMETLHWGIEDGVRRTNHPVCKEQMLDLVKHFGAEFGVKAETWEQLKFMLPILKKQNSYHRYEFLGKAVTAEPGAVDVQRALEILANGPVYCDVTLHAFVFDPKNETAYVSNAGFNPPVTATDRPFTKIDLSAWFAE